MEKFQVQMDQKRPTGERQNFGEVDESADEQG
jgi:hypothetical protein